MGRRLVLINAKFYISSGARVPLKNISGVYYIYDDKIHNGKYRITNRKSKVGIFPPIDFSIGYIDKKEADYLLEVNDEICKRIRIFEEW